MIAGLWGAYTNPKKLLYESPHPGLLPLEKVTMRTYWDWYYLFFRKGSLLLLIRPYEDLTSVRLEPVERLVCFDSLSTNGSNINRPNQ